LILGVVAAIYMIPSLRIGAGMASLAGSPLALGVAPDPRASPQWTELCPALINLPFMAIQEKNSLLDQIYSAMKEEL
jgi:hypothetical protein